MHDSDRNGDVDNDGDTDDKGKRQQSASVPI